MYSYECGREYYRREKTIGIDSQPIHLQFAICVSGRQDFVYGYRFDDGWGFKVSFGPIWAIQGSAY